MNSFRDVHIAQAISIMISIKIIGLFGISERATYYAYSDGVQWEASNLGIDKSSTTPRKSI
jgi:hypothetical protein